MNACKLRWMAGAALSLSTIFVPAGAQSPNLATPTASSQLASSQPPPYWAYPVNPPTLESAKPVAEDPSLQHVPDSDAAFTLTRIHDWYFAPDWHPEGHPAMPDIVARGRKPEVFACGFCHLPNGLGRPENSRLAGLPAQYIVQQLSDFKSGMRHCSEPKFLPPTNMTRYEIRATDEEILAAATYFSALTPKPWIRVIETDSVPQTHVAGWMLVANDPAVMEPIGHRIIETPADLERTELRDDQSPFVAYVPPGSLKRGETLVGSGGKGRTVACSTCHGPKLKGLSTAPPLAGRSPSYLVRQLYDIQSGTRAGANTHLMRPTVKKLTLDDMIAIASYVASLNP